MTVMRVTRDPRARYGRYGRPYQRLKETLRREGAHICWLCGEPIDMELSRAQPNHALAWTLDHVIPVSRGGAVLDPANVREAHRRCNSARGIGRPLRRLNTSRRW